MVLVKYNIAHLMEFVPKCLAVFLIIVNAVAVSGQDSSINSIGELKEALIPLLSGDSVDIEAVRVYHVLDDYNGDDWNNYAVCNNESFIHTLVDTVEGSFAIYVVCFPAGEGKPIHDHFLGYCFWKILEGSMLEVTYIIPSSPGVMKPISDAMLKPGDVMIDHDDFGIAHSIENLSPDIPVFVLFIPHPPYGSFNQYDPLTGAATVVDF